ncbi:hypothetical protein DSO57_1003690 [Entomophthora muscae]|uniref:Uncharacterized protein n=1 Tax=Entomophthora muscae TaxID=34485 RepID=A0ACC2U727_9FUNG|nr:hypothetical protein DSO57_1003690 [Entomophthora muscae]
MRRSLKMLGPSSIIKSGRPQAILRIQSAKLIKIVRILFLSFLSIADPCLLMGLIRSGVSFGKMGKAPEKTSFADLNAAPVLPAAFPEWEAIMNSWGTRMHDAVTGISQMLAVGLGLPKNTFSDMAKYGPHLLAPTGSDLNDYGAIDTVLAGFHYDLNFLTIHGKSRFPGLNVWARNSSRKIGVKVPSGCLLVQAGKEAEWLTGGKILAGYHEVVVNNKTIEAMQTARNEGRSLWRVSSTFFMHIGSDVLLQPVVLPAENQEEAKAKYPPTLCGTYVQNELFHINLKAQ